MRSDIVSLQTSDVSRRLSYRERCTDVKLELDLKEKNKVTKLLSIKTAADLLSISPWTVRSYIKTGKLRPVRLGRRVLLEESELERFVAFSKARPIANEGSEELTTPVQLEGLNA